MTIKVFPCIIKQIIIRRNIGDHTVVAFQRQIADVNVADFNTAVFYIPQRCDQLCDRRLAAAGQNKQGQISTAGLLKWFRTFSIIK